MRIVDLSAPIAPSPEATPPFLRTDIDYANHTAGAAQIQALLGVPSDLLRDGEGWAVETFTRFGTHDSTHVDAPWHYNSRIQGQRAQTIDELPLEWFFGNGVVLDMTAKPESDPMTAADAQAELARIGYALKPLDIVLVRTGRDAHYGQADYMFRGCGVTAEATRWLYEQGIRVWASMPGAGMRHSTSRLARRWRGSSPVSSGLRIRSICHTPRSSGW